MGGDRNGLFGLLRVMEKYFEVVDSGMIEMLSWAILLHYCNKSRECYQLFGRSYAFLEFGHVYFFM